MTTSESDLGFHDYFARTFDDVAAALSPSMPSLVADSDVAGRLTRLQRLRYGKIGPDAASEFLMMMEGVGDQQLWKAVLGWIKARGLVHLLKDFVTENRSDRPIARTKFFGRDDTLEAICSALRKDEKAAVFVVGVGGIRKTTIVLEALRRTGRGDVWISCSGAMDVSKLKTAILNALGISNVAPSNLNSAIQAKILVIDSLEKLLDGSRPKDRELSVLLDSLHTAVPILVTSRVPIKCSFEIEIVKLDSLGLLAATEMFLSYSQTAKFRGDSYLPNFMAKLDGYPLAIDLIAFRFEGDENLRTVRGRLDYEGTTGGDGIDTDAEICNAVIAVSLSHPAFQRHPAALHALQLVAYVPEPLEETVISAVLGLSDHRAFVDAVNGGILTHLFSPSTEEKGFGLSHKPIISYGMLAPIRESLRTTHPLSTDLLVSLFRYYREQAKQELRCHRAFPSRRIGDSINHIFVMVNSLDLDECSVEVVEVMLDWTVPNWQIEENTYLMASNKACQLGMVRQQGVYMLFYLINAVWSTCDNPARTQFIVDRFDIDLRSGSRHNQLPDDPYSLAIALYLYGRILYDSSKLEEAYSRFNESVGQILKLGDATTSPITRLADFTIGRRDPNRWLLLSTLALARISMASKNLDRALNHYTSALKVCNAKEVGRVFQAMEWQLIKKTMSLVWCDMGSTSGWSTAYSQLQDSALVSKVYRGSPATQSLDTLLASRCRLLRLHPQLRTSHKDGEKALGPNPRYYYTEPGPPTLALERGFLALELGDTVAAEHYWTLASLGSLCAEGGLVLGRGSPKPSDASIEGLRGKMVAIVDGKATVRLDAAFQEQYYKAPDPSLEVHVDLFAEARHRRNCQRAATVVYALHAGIAKLENRPSDARRHCIDAMHSAWRWEACSWWEDEVHTLGADWAFVYGFLADQCEFEAERREKGKCCLQ